MKLHSLLTELLELIETEISPRGLGNPTADYLADALFVSSVHLQRLFKAAFNITLANYIRLRRLASSLEKLHETDWAIADIAVEYGFEYARSYIRAFKQAFGITPGEARRLGQTIKITPPLALFHELESGLLFGPEIVYVPGFSCVGKSTIIRGDSQTVPAQAARHFWMNEKPQIPNRKSPDVFIGLTKFPKDADDYTIYKPSVQVLNLANIPPGYEGNTVPSGLCVHFWYIGEHHYMDIDSKIADGMYRSVAAFAENEQAKYKMFKHGIYFERINPHEYDGKICKMDWFSPVSENIERTL